jgi:hypothetical protein
MCVYVCVCVVCVCVYIYIYSHNIKMDNNSFERVGKLKYLGITSINQNSIQEQIKKTIKSRNTCYHSVHNLSFSSLLFKNIKIKIHRSIIFHVVPYGCEVWSLILTKERRLKNRVLGRIFGPKSDEVTGEWRILHNEELSDLYSSLNIVRVTKS